MVNNSETEIVVPQNKWDGLLQTRLFLSAVLILGVAVIVLIMMLLQKPSGFGQRSDIAVTVNGDDITMAEFFDAMYAQGGQDVLKQLITRRLIIREAEKNGIAVSDEMLDEEVASIVDESFHGSEEEFLEALKLYGISLQKFREDTRLSMQVQELAMKRIDITDDDIRTFIDNNPEILYEPDAVQVRHILVETREKAEQIIALLEQGMNFEDLAVEYSIDLANREAGGNLGYLTRGFMDEKFEEAAFALEVGEISEPVETPAGYHIIELLGHRVDTLLQFDDVKDDAREQLIEQKMFEVISEIVDTLNEDAKIEYFIETESD